MRHKNFKDLLNYIENTVMGYLKKENIIIGSEKVPINEFYLLEIRTNLGLKILYHFILKKTPELLDKLLDLVPEPFNHFISFNFPK